MIIILMMIMIVIIIYYDNNNDNRDDNFSGSVCLEKGTEEQIGKFPGYVKLLESRNLV